MTILDYINEFERLNNKICQFDMVLPTGVLAYKVLNNANISSEKKQLIRATVVSLTYENMEWTFDNGLWKVSPNIQYLLELFVISSNNQIMYKLLFILFIMKKTTESNI